MESGAQDSEEGKVSDVASAGAFAAFHFGRFESERAKSSSYTEQQQKQIIHISYDASASRVCFSFFV